MHLLVNCGVPDIKQVDKSLFYGLYSTQILFPRFTVIMHRWDEPVCILFFCEPPAPFEWNPKMAEKNQQSFWVGVFGWCDIKEKCQHVTVHNNIIEYAVIKSNQTLNKQFNWMLGTNMILRRCRWGLQHLEELQRCVSSLIHIQRLQECSLSFQFAGTAESLTLHSCTLCTEN